MLRTWEKFIQLGELISYKRGKNELVELQESYGKYLILNECLIAYYSFILLFEMFNPIRKHNEEIKFFDCTKTNKSLRVCQFKYLEVTWSATHGRKFLVKNPNGILKKPVQLGIS